MTAGTLYFGYGSNLWKDQMRRRCPTSKYKGVARLNKFRWIINERGYANVVETGQDADVVYGLVYLLKQDDEDKLDRNEGVPVAYTKEDIAVQLWTPEQGEQSTSTATAPKDVKMLVYINRRLTKPDKPKPEYIVRMNKGITDALDAGIPQSYIDDVLRKFLPSEDDPDEQIGRLAEKQAFEFEEET